MNRTERGMRRYFVELTGAFAVFFATMYARSYWHAAPAPFGLLAGISPVMGVWLAAAAIVRGIRAMDEFFRQRMLNTIGISAAITAIFALSWQLLVDPLHLPNLSIIWCWPVMGGAWFVIAMFEQKRDEIREDGSWKAFWPYGASQLVGLLLFAYAIAGHYRHWPAVIPAFWTASIWVIGTAGVGIFKRRACR